MYEVEILNEGKHVGWLTGSDMYEVDTIAFLIEEAGYEIVYEEDNDD